MATEVFPALAAHCTTESSLLDAACTELHALAVDIEQPLCRRSLGNGHSPAERARALGDGFLASVKAHCVLRR